jgi:hypothetical protein
MSLRIENEATKLSPSEGRVKAIINLRARAAILFSAVKNCGQK